MAERPSEAPPTKTIMPNRAGEPDFKLEMTPDVINFICSADQKPVWCDLKIKNTTKDKQSFKVKCTSADIFRVQPPLGLVKVDEQITVKIWFQNKQIPPESQKHYFAIYHVKAPEGKTVKDIWTKTAKPEGVRRLAAVFTKS